jgi:hypothetical protein
MTAQLGLSVVRVIVLRLMLPNVGVLAASLAAAIYHQNWGWLGVGGTVITAAGATYMTRRLLRLGVDSIDSELPAPVLSNNQFNFAHVGERIERLADNWCALVGFWITLAGTIMAGALPFTLDALLPFR